MRSPTKPKVIVALDYAEPKEAFELVARLEGAPCTLKVGLELFTAGGPALVEVLVKQGFPIFLDLKLHDIPHTVGKATERARSLGVSFLTVHLLGGRTMIEAATVAAESALTILGVSVLTSHSRENWGEILRAASGSATGVQGVPEIQNSVLGLIRQSPSLAQHGVVCSAHEVAAVKAAFPTIYAVTPGVRLAGEGARDQARVVTPEEAFSRGADAIVLGQTVRASKDPAALLRQLA